MSRIVTLNSAYNATFSSNANNGLATNANRNVAKSKDMIGGTTDDTLLPAGGIKNIPMLPSNAMVAALKGSASLNHDLDNNNTNDGHFQHNTLDEYYKEPMYFGTENSTVITTQIGANAHLPCAIHNIGEGVVSICHVTHTHTYTNIHLTL